MKKDVGVEIARIIACLQVICVHVCLPMIENGHLLWNRAVVAGLCADGVAVFWMISGFFMFRNYDFKKTMKRTFKKIVLPLLVVDVLCFFFGDFLFRSVPLFESISFSVKDLFLYMLQIFRGYTPESEFAHLWFMRVYILLMLVSPFVFGFIEYLKKDSGRVKMFMIITTVLMMINDFGANQLFNFSSHSINGLIPAIIEMVWGWIIYNYLSREKIENNGIVKPIAIFILLNVFRPAMYQLFMKIGFTDTKIYYWYSLFGVLCAACIVILSINIGKIIVNQKVIYTLRILGAGTFTVYIFHMMVYSLFRKIGYIDFLNNLCSFELAKSTLTVSITAMSIFAFVCLIRIVILERYKRLFVVKTKFL